MTPKGDAVPTPPVHPSFPAWRYIEPADKSSSIVVGDHTYKLCSKCCCHATGKQGYFTTTHGTAEHIDKKVSFPSVEANHAPVAPILPLVDDSLAGDDIPDDEMLVFSGPWCTPIADQENIVVSCVIDNEHACESPSLWLASISSVSSVNTNDDNQDNDSDLVRLNAFPAGAANDETPVAVIQVDDPDFLVPDGSNISADVAPVALPVVHQPPSSDSFLLMNESYLRLYNTRLPLSIVDLDYTEYFPCDVSPCSAVGPGGFNCPRCPLGIFNTALVICHSCHHGHGFLGDSCEFCGQGPLWGPHVLPACLPTQSLDTYVDNDPSGVDFLPRNPARSSHILLDSVYYPFSPSANCVASCRPFLSDLALPTLSSHYESFSSPPCDPDEIFLMLLPRSLTSLLDVEELCTPMYAMEEVSVLKGLEEPLMKEMSVLAVMEEPVPNWAVVFLAACSGMDG